MKYTLIALAALSSTAFAQTYYDFTVGGTQTLDSGVQVTFTPDPGSTGITTTANSLKSVSAGAPIVLGTLSFSGGPISFELSNINYVSPNDSSVREQVTISNIFTGDFHPSNTAGISPGHTWAAPSPDVRTITATGNSPDDTTVVALSSGGPFTISNTSTTSAGEVHFGNIRAIAPVPEPSSAALLGLGGLALILRRRK